MFFSSIRCKKSLALPHTLHSVKCTYLLAYYYLLLLINMFIRCNFFHFKKIILPIQHQWMQVNHFHGHVLFDMTLVLSLTCYFLHNISLFIPAIINSFTFVIYLCKTKCLPVKKTIDLKCFLSYNVVCEKHYH